MEGLEALFISVENGARLGQMADPGNMGAPIMDASSTDHEFFMEQLLALLKRMNIKGLRFAPTEAELMELLAKFVSSRKTGRDTVDNRCIPVVNLNKVEPREIPGLCQTEFPGDKTEYYLFHRSTRKYPTSNREDRSTGEGYWKATGKPTAVKDKNNIVIGERKTLVFYNARNTNKVSPNEGKTDWIMHEFRPVGHGINSGDATWVVCSVSFKPLPPPASPTGSQHRGLSPGPASPLSSSTSAASGGGKSETGRVNKNKSPPQHFDDPFYGNGLPSPGSASSLGAGENFNLDQEGGHKDKAPRIEMGNRSNLARSVAFVLRQDEASDGADYRREMLNQWPGPMPVPDAGFLQMENWNPPAELPPAGLGCGLEVNEVAGGVIHNPSFGSRPPPSQEFLNALSFNTWERGVNTWGAAGEQLVPGNNMEALAPSDMGLDGEGSADFHLWTFSMEGSANSGS